MSNHKDNDKHRRNDVLKSLPAEVLLKARNRLLSFGGALKPKNEISKNQKQDSKNKKSERLKNVRSDPEFSRKAKHRSRIDDVPREYGIRPRPLSVGAMKRYDEDMEFHCGSYPKDMILQRQFDSSEDVCVQSRLMVPLTDRIAQDIHIQDTIERPRKKLSFREPEIVSSGNATLGRSHKLMGVNSLSRRPNRMSLRSDHYSSFEGLDSDLESQAMRIVRTVGQAFEVCHKMQSNSPDPAAPSTSSAADDQYERGSDAPIKEPASECGVTESIPSTSKGVEEKLGNQRPKSLDLLPPPPRKERRRTQQPVPSPNLNLPDLPECVTKVDVQKLPEGDATTPLSAQHQLQLLRERLEQQAQQTRAAVAQLLLLRDQLAAEQAARCEAQARTHQLLVHNKELIEHIAALVSHLQEKEKGNARPINSQQLTMLPQSVLDGTKEEVSTENYGAYNGKCPPFDNEALMKLLNQNNNVNQNVENNNIQSPFSSSPSTSQLNGPTSVPNFSGMTNDQIQNYLISKFQDINFNGNNDSHTFNKQYYQNSKAFPNIPPLTNHCSNTDLASLMTHQIYKEKFNSSDELGAAQAMSISQSQNSLNSESNSSTSKDSSPDGSSSDDSIPFIMPLSHKGTLKATGDDGKVRIIVPVSPSESVSKIEAEKQNENKEIYAVTLKVPTLEHTLAPPAPITRSTSEKVPNRSEMMTALRSQWTRHTTK